MCLRLGRGSAGRPPGSGPGGLPGSPLESPLDSTPKNFDLVELC